MKKTLGMHFGERKLRKFTHRCDEVLRTGNVHAHYAWYGTSTGGGIKVWKEYIKNFLKIYKKEYNAGHHQMVAVATLLSLADVYGINHSSKDQFKCNLNHSCQMGETGDYKYVPICKIEIEDLVARAMEEPASKKWFTVKVKCCEETDGDPRTARKTKERRIDFKI